MVRDIVKDQGVLQTKSIKVTGTHAEREAFIDLRDTAIAHKDNCYGLAAIQIGQPMRIIAARRADGKYTMMINPVVTWKSSQKYVMEEGCLSLPGTQPVERPVKIDVMYQDCFGGGYIRSRLSGVMARIVQHQIDHLNGVLI